jgi:hypothetical protein
MRCPWRRQQVKASHGDLTRYGRRCIWNAGHVGAHEVPRRAKQANDGVWFNPETGETLTQHGEEVQLW